MPLIIKKHIIMYARKYYLIIYRRNLIPEYTRTCQQQYSRTCQLAPSLFTKSHIWPFDLLTFWPFCHSLHTPYSSNSPRSPFTSFTTLTFTFSLSLFHLFLSSSSPFPHLTPPSSIPLHLTTSGTKTEKIRDNSFISRKNVLTLQP